MRTKDWIKLGSMFVLVALMGTAVMAEDEEGGRRRGGEGRQEMRRFRQEQRQARREHARTQHEENRAFRKTLEGKAPNEACGEIIGHREQQFGENNSFVDSQHEAFVQFATGLMEENEVPAEQQAERLAKINERYAEMSSKHQARQSEIIATLRELSGKDDLTWEEVKAAMAQFRQRHGDQDSEGRKGREGREGQERRRGRRRNRDAGNSSEGV